MYVVLAERAWKMIPTIPNTQNRQHSTHKVLEIRQSIDNLIFTYFSYKHNFLSLIFDNWTHLEYRLFGTEVEQFHSGCIP